LHGYQLEPVEGTSEKVNKIKIIKKKNWHLDNTYNVFNYADFSYNDNTYYTQKGNIALMLLITDFTYRLLFL
jgi:hypothetical protein